MSQSTHNQLSNKVIEKTISTSIKKEIATLNIDTTTRRGNKELKFLTGKIAKYPFNNVEQARIAGAKLGQHLAAILQQRGKKNLDGGTIQQVHHQKELFSIAGLSEEKQTSDRVSTSDNLTSTDLEQPTEETLAQDEVVDNATTITTEEAQTQAEEFAPPVQPNDESSSNEPDNFQDVSKTSELAD